MSYAGKLVGVSWYDAWFDKDEISLNDFKDEFPMLTFGICVRDTKAVLSVAHEKNADGLYRAVTHIPRGMINKVATGDEIWDMIPSI